MDTDITYTLDKKNPAFKEIKWLISAIDFKATQHKIKVILNYEDGSIAATDGRRLHCLDTTQDSIFPAVRGVFKVASNKANEVVLIFRPVDEGDCSPSFYDIDPKTGKGNVLRTSHSGLINVTPKRDNPIRSKVKVEQKSNCNIFRVANSITLAAGELILFNDLFISQAIGEKTLLHIGLRRDIEWNIELDEERPTSSPLVMHSDSDITGIKRMTVITPMRPVE
ncbi:hypothetical protein OAB00_01420 [Akkermansiaceae bacterium]|nr:hypothetical protein [Akkermansiaceae bacterium]